MLHICSSGNHSKTHFVSVLRFCPYLQGMGLKTKNCLNGQTVAWTEIKNRDSSFLIPLFLLTILQSQPHGAEGHPLCSSDISALLPLRMENLFTATMEDESSWLCCSLSHLLVLFLKTCTSSFSSGDQVCFHHQSLLLRTWWSPGPDQLQGDLLPCRAPSFLLIPTALLFSLSFLQFFHRPLRSVQSLPTGRGAFLNCTKLNHFRWEWILGCLQQTMIYVTKLKWVFWGLGFAYLDIVQSHLSIIYYFLPVILKLFLFISFLQIKSWNLPFQNYSQTFPHHYPNFSWGPL